MSDTIVLTKDDVPVGRVCDAAKHLERVLIIGEDANGQLIASSSHGEHGWLLRVMAEFQFKLLNGDYAGDEQ